MNKYLKLIFTIVIILVTINWIGISIKKIYFSVFTASVKTKGKVIGIERNVSMEGGLSFEYNIVFNINGRNVFFTQLFSPDSLNVKVGDSVKVNYAKKNPKVATLKVNDNFLFEVSIMFFLAVFSFILLSLSFNDFKGDIRRIVRR